MGSSFWKTIPAMHKKKPLTKKNKQQQNHPQKNPQTNENKQTKTHKNTQKKKTPKNHKPTQQNPASYKEISNNLHIMVSLEYIAKATVFKRVFYHKSVTSFTHSWMDNWKVWFWETLGEDEDITCQNLVSWGSQPTDSIFPLITFLHVFCLPNYPDTTLSRIAK